MKEVRGNGSRVLAIFSDPDCPYCQKLETDLRTPDQRHDLHLPDAAGVAAPGGAHQGRIGVVRQGPHRGLARHHVARRSRSPGQTVRIRWIATWRWASDWASTAHPR
jgi:hypothetical protein